MVITSKHNEMTAHDTYRKVFGNIEKVIHGQSGTIRKLLAALFCGGHVLLEDVPGTGKTTLAKAIARSLDVGYHRIQFTPDLLPTDILGVSIFDPRSQQFNFHPGPVFTNVLLADEINRASPRTQSALLEAMAEGQVSSDGEVRTLDKLFFVIATQNPIDFHGTYPLPEAQMDRFAMRLSLGYVTHEEEIAIITAQVHGHPLDQIRPCVARDEVLALRERIFAVRISDEIKNYIVSIIRATRDAPGVINGASPRASLALMKTAQALALFDGMEFVTPEHVQEAVVPVVAHRIILDPQMRFSGKSAEDALRDTLAALPVPA